MSAPTRKRSELTREIAWLRDWFDGVDEGFIVYREARAMVLEYPYAT